MVVKLLAFSHCVHCMWKLTWKDHFQKAEHSSVFMADAVLAVLPFKLFCVCNRSYRETMTFSYLCTWETMRLVIAFGYSCLYSPLDCNLAVKCSLKVLYRDLAYRMSYLFCFCMVKLQILKQNKKKKPSKTPSTQPGWLEYKLAALVAWGIIKSVSVILIKLVYKSGCFD